jgi:hypothetical protein
MFASAPLAQGKPLAVQLVHLLVFASLVRGVIWVWYEQRQVLVALAC